MAKRKRGWEALTKRCDCRDQALCSHPFHLRLEHHGRTFGGPLWKLAGLPRHQRLTLDEAKSLRDRLRSEIFAGTFASAIKTPMPTSTAPLTFDDVAARYVAARRQDASRRPHRLDRLASEMAVIARTEVPGPQGSRQPFGSLVFSDIRRHHLESFREERRAMYRVAEEAATARQEPKAGQGHVPPPSRSTERPGRARGETGINRYLQALRTCFNWAVEQGYCEGESPFQHRGRPALRLTKERARARRLSEDETNRVMLAANPHLKACIIAALETGMRRGEILGLRWSDVVFAGAEPEWLVLRADGTKNGKSRSIPVSPTLGALLKARRHDPTGEPFGPEAYVFGNAVGERQDSIKTAWAATLSRAGITGLCFHDLRREAGSRYSEAGLPLHHIKELLGHANISTTSRYLAVTPVELQRSLLAAAQQRNTGRRLG